MADTGSAALPHLLGMQCRSASRCNAGSKVFQVAAVTLVAPCGAPLLQAIVKAWRACAAASRKWRMLKIDDPGEEGERPPLRSPAHVHASQNQGGVSPPPFHACGWHETSSGWQKHRRASKWLRKPGGFGGPVFFFLPDESLWTTTPSGLFMSVDECAGFLTSATNSFNESLLRMCFSTWRTQASVTIQWRYKISLFGSSADDSTMDKSHDSYASAEAERFTSSDAIWREASQDDSPFS